MPEPTTERTVPADGRHGIATAAQWLRTFADGGDGSTDASFAGPAATVSGGAGREPGRAPRER